MKHRVPLVESEEGWAVWCDDMPGCCLQGATREEALASIRELIPEYLAVQAEQFSNDSAVRSVQQAYTVADAAPAPGNAVLATIE